MPSLRRQTGPEIAIAERLEHVRGRVRCSTLRDFWRELTLDGAYQVSYEAIRNYHHDREPPVEYLVQVARVFGVDLQWLATGEGGAWGDTVNGNGAGNGNGAVNGNGHDTRPEVADDVGDARRGYEEGIREHLRRFDQLPPLAATVMLRTCDRLYRDAHLRTGLTGHAGPTRAYVGRFVGKAVAGPLVNAVAGTVKTSDLHPWQLETYVLGICGALTALIPNPNWVGPQTTDEVH
ncbi:MAG: helix-turn-helix domain containing protein [Gemmatimonadetes bacterium]|nr:helix-turn-helix domain containing protein [Gemmatimonadota bacterium]